MPRKMFISFANENKDFVEMIARRLRSKFRSLQPVVIEWESQPRAEFGELVAKRMKDCSWYMVLLTKHSVNNQWVNQELGYAECLRRNGRITTVIPIVERPAKKKPPIEIAGFIHNSHASVPYLAKPTDWDYCLTELERYVRTRLKMERAPAPEDLRDRAAALAGGGDLWEAGQLQRRVAEMLAKRRNWKQGEAAFRVAIEYYREAEEEGYAWERASCLRRIADMRRRDGRPLAVAKAYIERTETLQQDEDYAWEAAKSSERAGDLLAGPRVRRKGMARGCYEQARRLYKRDEEEKDIARCSRKIRRLGGD